MNNQPTLFYNPPAPKDPTKPDKFCPICHQPYIYDKHGAPRHRKGDAKKCDELLRRAKESAQS